MKLLNQILILVIGFLFVSLASHAAENPNVSTSFRGNNTVPSEGQRRRTAPNPVGNSNDVVTGNVGGLRYFHGVVPYGSRYYSGGNMNDSSTRSVNSFIRRSVNPILSDRNPTQSRPYYQASSTTSTFRNQATTVNSGPTDIITGRLASSSYQNLPSLPPTGNEVTQRPLSSNNLELDLILARQFELRQAAEQNRPNQLLENVSERDQSEYKHFFDNLLPLPQEKKTPAEETEDPQVDPILDSELQVLQQLQQESENALTEPDSNRINLQDQTLPQEADQQGETQETSTPGSQINPRLLERLEAAQIQGEYNNFQNLAQAKVSNYLQAAEQFIMEGKYYKAADAYDLALVWASQDPRPYAGKSFSLFAAGEYMSSAYYLSRAIELKPELAARQVDIAKLIGDRDTYEDRLIELTTWQQRSGSGELAFLQAYLYHHDSKPSKASMAIAVAAEKMPESPAVMTLNNVINTQAQDR